MYLLDRNHNRIVDPPFEREEVIVNATKNAKYILLRLTALNENGDAKFVCLGFLTLKWQAENTSLLMMLQCLEAHACLWEYKLQGFCVVFTSGQVDDTFQLFPKSSALVTKLLSLAIKSFLFPS